MTSKDLVAACQTTGQKYRIDRVRIRAGKSEWTGLGSLAVSDKRFRLEVTLDTGQSEPPVARGITGRSGFWEIRGLIDGKLGFVAHGLSHSRSLSFGGSSQITLRIDTKSLEIPPTGIDSLTDNEKSALLDRARSQAEEGIDPAAAPASDKAGQAAETSKPIDSGARPATVRFNALIKGFKLIFCDGGTQVTENNPFLGESWRSLGGTCQGEVPGWKFWLIQRAAELEVHFRSKDGHISQSIERDESLFRAFLNGLAFTHGQHAWPLWLQQWRDGKLVLDRIHVDTEAKRSSHAPFSEWLVYHARLKDPQWKLQDCLEKAFDFFAVEGQLRDEITRLLYLLREATSSGVAHSITVLAVCSLFESLIRGVYKHRIAASAEADTKAFEAIKGQVCTYLTERAKTGDEVHYNRLHSILQHAEALRIRDQFNDVVSHLGLNADYWGEAYRRWTRSRNPASHRITSSDGSEDTDRAAIIAESRLAGAINGLVLKLVGYTGPAVGSSFEDMLVQIGLTGSGQRPQAGNAGP